MSVSSPTLGDVLAEVRMLLAEPAAVFWNDVDLIYSINKGLQDMCSDAQNLETPIQFTWPGVSDSSNAIAQEALLPVDMDQIIWVGYYSGQFFQLEQFDSDDMIKVANRVSGIPIGFYTHTATQAISTQGGGQTTGDLLLTNFNPNSTNLSPNPSQLGQFIGNVPTASTPQLLNYTTVMGLWPIPLQNLDVTIMCSRYHPPLVNNSDVIAIPSRFSDGPVHYCMWKAKLKQQDFDVAEKYKGYYMADKLAMNNYYLSHKQLKTFPTYGGSHWPTLARGSSSVIFIDQAPGVIGR